MKPEQDKESSGSTRRPEGEAGRPPGGPERGDAAWFVLSVPFYLYSSVFALMSHLHRCHTCLCLLLLLLASQAAAQTNTAPVVIPFQGLLTSQIGQPVPDGKYSLIFNLYAEAMRPASGGQPLWSERHASVGVTNGQVNVFLGSQPGNPVSLASLDFSVVKYLGITIDTDDRASTADPEMTPRQVIIPPWYALKTPNSNLLQGYSWTAFMTGSDPATASIDGSRFTAGSITPAQMASGAILANLAADDVDTLLSSTASPVPTGYSSAGTVTLSGGATTFYLFKKN